jgi:MFS family permease
MMPSSQIIMINSLSDEDRVTGLSISRAIMGIAGMIGPMVCALIINYFGGLDSADNIRPLFLIQFVVGLFTMVFLVTQMQEVTVTRGKQKAGVLGNLFGVFKEVPLLKLLMLRQCVNMFLMSLGRPFLTIYLVDVKGANEFILGWRGTVRTALAVCLSIPIGRLADKMGRRRVAYFGRVFGWAGLLLMILTPPTHPEYLIIAGVLESLRMLMFVGWMAFDQELIPIEARGRYSGVSMMLNGMVGVFAPIIGGLMWEFNPDYIWWIRILGGALVVLPLMIIIGYKASKSET